MNQETCVRMRTYYESVSKPPAMTQSDLQITKTLLFSPERVKNNFINLQRLATCLLKCLYGQQGFCCFGISVMCKKVF